MDIYVATVCGPRPWHVTLLHLLFLLAVLVVLPLVAHVIWRRNRARHAMRSLPAVSRILLAFVLLSSTLGVLCAALTASHYRQEARVVREYAPEHAFASALTAAFHRQAVLDAFAGGVAVTILLTSLVYLVLIHRSSLRRVA